MTVSLSDRYRQIQLINLTNLSNLLQGIEYWQELNLIPDTQTEIKLITEVLTNQNNLNLDITTEITLSRLKLGLKTWIDQEILSQANINLSLHVNVFDPAFLDGLDNWLQLGILSDKQVKTLCQTHLTSTIPIPLVKTSPFPPKTTPKPPRKRSTVEDILQRLMAELSVIWLLLLGVFMVVISSGVLAASQWEKFPSVGQYGILWLYTLGFGVASGWTSKKNNLRLTTLALQVVSLVLVPVNFLAMDSFRLWNSPLGWIVMGIAAISLTLLTTKLFNSKTTSDNSFLALLNQLVLSYLQLGWTIPSIPLFATYFGVIGTAILVQFQPKDRETQSLFSTPFTLRVLTVIYSLAVLLIRAIFIARINPLELGLAVAILGWLIVWRFSTNFSFGKRVGESLLLLGWLLSVTSFPWQAIAVSILALVWLTKKLRQTWLQRDLLSILLVVLQLHWLLQRVLPLDSVIQWSIEVTKTQDTPWSLLSLGLFPYLVFIIVLNRLFSRLFKDNLVQLSNKIAIFLGIILTSFSLVSPVLRTLNLAVSTLTLGKVTQAKNKYLRTLTHVGSLLTVVSAINWLFPTLNNTIWGIILLFLMAIEAYLDFIYLKTDSVLRSWGQSSWSLSLILGLLSYACFWVNTSSIIYPKINPILNFIWYFAPVILTVISIKNNSRKVLSTQLSIVCLGLFQGLTFGFAETRLIGLIAATGLMVINTFYLPHWLSATITVGFGISVVTIGLWDGLFGVTVRSPSSWLLIIPILTTILWILHHYLQPKQETMKKSIKYYYSQGVDIWGFLLCSLTLWGLTWHSWAVYGQFIPSSLQAIAASFLLIIIIIYRSWKDPTNWTIYGLGWSLELLTIEVLGMIEKSLITLAVANIILGLLTQILGEWWHKRTEKVQYLSSWHILPLLYGGLGTALRGNFFSSWTGLTSLGLVLIIIGVGKRKERFKPLLYLAIVGVSWSFYELLFYQIEGWPMGDRLSAMATLATTIMYGYRLCCPWLSSYLRFSLRELLIVSHLHWLLGTVFLLSAIFYPMTFNPIIGLGTGIFLTRYAIMQGRNNNNKIIAETWVYLGLIQGGCIGFYASSLVTTPVIFRDIFEIWMGSFIAILSLFIRGLPWQQWGWTSRPWQVLSLLLPLIGVATTFNGITLLVAAGCYGILSTINQQKRLLYLTLLLGDGAILYWFNQFDFIDTFLFPCVVGLSILSIIWIDPFCQRRESQKLRHYLRIFGSSIIGFSSLLFYPNTGLIPGLLSILTILLGLSLQIRAFLFVGTTIFIINGFYQLVILSFTYSLLKWIIGLVMGLIFIWTAANFETHRTQLSSFIHHWITAFEEWE